MRRPNRGRLWAGAALATSAAALVGTPSLAAGEARPASPTGVVEGSYIVVYRDAVSRPAAATAARERGLHFEAEYTYSSALSGFSARLGSKQLEAIRNDPDVASVAANRWAAASATVPLVPGEPLPPTGVRRIRASTRTTTREASSSNVAILDTGIRLKHPDLNAAPGIDCVDPGTPPSDRHGHGTHVAGTVGALNNGSGVVGVAPGTKVYAVRVLDDAGYGSFAEIICGIDWVTAKHRTKHIDVANMSLGGIDYPDPTQPCATTTAPLHKAICNSTAGGVNYVVAAGNDASYFDHPSFPTVPAAYPEVLTVTAMGDSDGRAGQRGPPGCYPYGSDDAHASFSNFTTTAIGEAHTIAAPGVCINSTWEFGYAELSGTSMASPHVAGLVALCIGEVSSVPGPCATRTPAEVITYMRAEASRWGNAHPELGFVGDPLDPLWPRYYGFLAHGRPSAAPAS